MESNQQPQEAIAKRSTNYRFLVKKKTAAFSRWLHVYLSMVSFIIVLFFSVTGITLNHTEWFDGTQVEKKVAGAVPAAWVNTPDTALIKKLEIVELLRKQFDVKGYVSDFLVQDDQCSISFKSAGYSADIFINRSDGKFQLTELRLGIVAVLNDLHKGRDSGKAWGWLIDISAVFLILVSLSGLAMLLFLKKKRLNGLLVGIVGGIVCWLVYWLLVP